MVKTLRKELRREIRASLPRFLSILAMVALGVLFLVGLRSAAPDMRDTADRYFDDVALRDVEILSTLGLTAEDIDAFSKVRGVETALGGQSLDGYLYKEETRKTVKLLSLTPGINSPTLLEGRLPEKPNECALDEKVLTNLKLSPGDTVTLESGLEDALKETAFTVTGSVVSPLYISLDRGTSTLGDGTVAGFVLLPENAFSLDYFTAAQILVSGAATLDAYGTAYDDKIDDAVESLEAEAGERAALRYQALHDDPMTELEAAQTELDDARLEAEEAFAESEQQLSDARTDLDEGWDGLEQAKSALALGLMTQTQIDELEETLEDGEEQYAEGLEALAEARETAAEEFSDAQEELDENRELLEDLEPAEVYVLDRDSNYGFVSYDQNATRMENLARVFPLIFFLVAALVSLTTMTRMVEEERTQIGAVKAMGYDTAAIAWKFLTYGALAALAGSILGSAIGTTFIPWVIFTSYGIMYRLPALHLTVHWGLCLASGLTGIGCTALATAWAVLSTARQTPAALLRPKAPRAGKRILLERIGPLWRRMRFSLKVSARNLFRYKKRLWMTVIGVAGCTALLIAGLGLRSSIFGIIDIQYGELYHYNIQLTLDGGTEDAEARVEQALENSGNLRSLAPVRTRSVTFRKGGVSVDGYVSATDRPEDVTEQILFRDMKTKEPVPYPAAGVMLDEKLAEQLSVGPGDTITIDAGTPKEVPVTAVTEHYVYHYAYMTAADYEALTGEAYTPNEYLITVEDDSTEAVSALCETLLTLDGVRGATNLPAMAKAFRDSIDAVDAAVMVIVLSAAALAFVVLYNLTNINIAERMRELATIKVLGFYDGEVAMYVYRENLVLTVLGILLGQPCGKLLTTWLVRTIEMDVVMFGRDARPGNYVLSILLSLAFAALVNFVMFFRLRKIDMVQSLKSVE